MYKRQIKNISQLRQFVVEFLDRVLDMSLFCGYCWNQDWDNLFYLNQINKRDITGIQVLKGVGKVNKNELLKLFSEWSNLVKKNKKKIKNNSKPNNTNNFESIQNSVKRSNFKFPWSFIEVWESSVETFLSFTELINFNFLPKNSASNYFIIIY